MDDCIFCKIIKGEIPCYKIWENTDLICFLDIEPVSRGHCLIVTKEHIEGVTDAPDSLLMWILPKIKESANLLVKKLGAKGFNILQNNGKIAGQSVLHLHFHIIPIYKNDNAKVVCGKSTNPNSKEFEKVLEEIKE